MHGPLVHAGTLPEAVSGTRGLEGINEEKCNAAAPFLCLQRPDTDTSSFSLCPSALVAEVCRIKSDNQSYGKHAHILSS